MCSSDLSFDESNSVVLSVNMGKKAPKGGDCPIDAEGFLANQKAKQQSGKDPMDYTHREYIIPWSFGCAWGGLANVGCANDGDGPQPGACFAWINEDYPTTRAHEFGHNIGLDHGGRWGQEYGDDSSIMGASASWRGFTAPSRFFMGWLTDAAKKTYSSAGLVSLRSLHLNPSTDTSGDYSALAFNCAQCEAESAGLTGGEIIVSFRTPNGYDRDLDGSFQNKVSVHLQPEGYGSWWQGITELLAVLGAGARHDALQVLAPLGLAVGLAYRNLAQLEVAHVDR